MKGKINIDNNKNSISKKIYNTTEVSKLLGIGKNKVYELIRHGYLSAIDLGGLKIPDEEINNFINKYKGYSFKNMKNLTPLNIP